MNHENTYRIPVRDLSRPYWQTRESVLLQNRQGEAFVHARLRGRQKDAVSCSRSCGTTDVTALQLQRLLDRARMSQRAAAMALEINERSMRRYCSGEQPVPKTVELALLYLVSQSDAGVKAVGSTNDGEVKQ